MTTSKYTLNQIKKYAHDAIKDILPLDDDSIDEMVQYTLTNFKTKEAISNHFIDILGTSDMTFAFVSRLGDMIFGTPENVPMNGNNDDDDSGVNDKKNGDVGKKIVVKKSNKLTPKPGVVRLVKTKKVQVGANSKGRMSSNSSKGSMTSEIFDMKPKTVEVQKIKKREIVKKLDNIKELDDVLMEIELMNSKNKEFNDGDDIRVCNCNATKHPLFEMYPNCLNCGKIICQKEGLQPCSNCGKSLMSEEDKEEIIDVLNKEKEKLQKEADEKNKEKQPKANMKKKKNVIKVSLNQTGQNNFKVKENFFKQLENNKKVEQENTKAKREEEELIEKNKNEMDYYKSIHRKDQELIKAEERLAMLLSFQDNGAERTKIIDQASDFEAPSNGAVSLWASPMERALQLKRQQKTFSRMEDARLQRSGRGKTQVDVKIENGKAVFVNTGRSDLILEDNLSEDEEISELQKKVNKEKQDKLENDLQPVYDYEHFGKALHRPVYLGNSVSTPDTHMDLPELGTVVQLGDADTQEEQLFSMVGV